MGKTKLIALTAATAALVAVPLGATPASADENHLCLTFPAPYSQICGAVMDPICQNFPSLCI